jgi:DNA invertase Pin-like site-specific DNA recombinase
MLGIMASFAEFEKARFVERVHAGLARAKRQGKRLGRPRLALVAPAASGLTVRQAATLWGCSKSTAARRLAAGKAPASVAVA